MHSMFLIFPTLLSCLLCPSVAFRSKGASALVPLASRVHFDSVLRKVLVRYHKNLSGVYPRAISCHAGRMKVGVHSGKFHCDEALGVVLLKYLPEYKDAELVRSRDPNELAVCDVVLDVGGVFDHCTGRYDHHQRGFTEKFGEDAASVLSSAGLIYRQYGKRILQEAFGIKSADTLDVIYQKLYSSFIESIDANDNGVAICDGKPRYSVKTDLPHRIGRLNPAWNSTNKINLNTQFRKAMDIVKAEFEDQVNDLVEVWWPARDLVKTALVKRHEVHPSGQIIDIGSWCPFSNHLYDLEKSLSCDKLILYVLFQDADSWRVRAVGVEGEAFLCRRPLPEQLRGLRDDAASQAAKIDGIIFAHATGFIAGTQTREAALRLADWSLKFSLE